MGYNDTQSRAITNDHGYILRLENKVKVLRILHNSVLKYREINNIKSQIINLKNVFPPPNVLC